MGNTWNTKHDTTLEERLLAKRVIDPETDCWLFQGGKQKSGHGKLGYKGRTLNVHVVAYQIWNGEILRGLCVLHHCGEPSCFNPKHLYLGNKKDNGEDTIRHGNSTTGEKNPNVKLTWDIVNSIRYDYNMEKMTQKDLVKKYGVSKASIHVIVTYKQWK